MRTQWTYQPFTGFTSYIYMYSVFSPYHVCVNVKLTDLNMWIFHDFLTVSMILACLSNYMNVSIFVCVCIK